MAGLLRSVVCVALSWFASWATRAAETQVRITPFEIPSSGRAGFVRLDGALTGIQFTNRISPERLERNQVLELGAGVALGDVNGDGRPDLYVCASEGGNRLYLNRGGWKFSDATAAAGLSASGQASTGAALADLDGDGDLDLLVNSLEAGTRLYLNDGVGRFAERTVSGLPTNNPGTSLALADIDGNGTLDLYVANYRRETVKDQPGGLDDVRAGYVNGEFVVTPPGRFLPIHLKSGGVRLFERAEPDALLLNDGQGRFQPVSWTNGAFLDEAGKPLTEAPKDWALAAAFRDMNRDGAPDLYVCNDFFFSPDRIWINDGTGKFRALPARALRQSSMSSMAVDFADINRDGWDDFLVLDMLSRSHERRHRQRGSLVHLEAILDPQFRLEVPRNTLALNRGDGTYAEIAQLAGIEASEWSWGVAFIDVDLDGYEDVLITTGNLRDANDADVARQNSRMLSGPSAAAGARPLPPRLESPCLAFRNRGDLTFQEVGAEWGWDTADVSHGLALADLDGDGDLDAVVNHLDQGLGVYRNDSAAPRLAIRLYGKPPNTQAIGARMVVHGGAVPEQSQVVISGGRYLSSDDPLRVFAAGGRDRRLRVEVTWPNGRFQRIENVPANSRLEVWEADHDKLSAPPTPRPAPERWFEDFSGRLPTPLPGEGFDNFAIQPLLTRRLSELGPGLSWFDADGDGWDDLILGAARAGQLVLYQNDQKGGFRGLRRPERAPEGHTGILGWRGTNSAAAQLIVGLAQMTPSAKPEPSAVQFALQGQPRIESLPASTASTGPMALGLLDGRLALFVGGRVQAGRYPHPASSQILIRHGDEWRVHEASSELRDVGLVSGAVWADWDGDGAPELTLACEWGLIRFFSWRGSRLVELTEQLGLADYAGWWTSVAAGDFDGDGRLDLVAGNLGRNTKYQRHLQAPVRIYYGDWDGDGTTELLEAYADPVLGAHTPFAPLDVLRRTAPSLAAKFPDFASYARSSLGQILAEHQDLLRVAEARWPDTTLFMNRGGRFAAHPLPVETQFSPVFGLAVGDFDGDGREDLFAAQNFLGVEPDTSPYDAGRGLLLQGNGRGGFRPLPGYESGLALDGAQRAAAVADFDGDARLDLAVAQHQGPLALFHNRVGRPGLRVKLAGPPENPEAIGAVVRLEYPSRLGPARSRNAGSGYWSQDSATLVLGISDSETPTHVRVRWPEGKESRHAVPPEGREVPIAFPSE